MLACLRQHVNLAGTCTVPSGDLESLLSSAEEFSLLEPLSAVWPFDLTKYQAYLPWTQESR
jgi:hypothetical protein